MGYYVKHNQVLPNGQVQWPWRDGNGINFYNGRLRMKGGWNDVGSFLPYDTTNQIWESFDGGATWTQIADPPWFRRHSFGSLVAQSKEWVFGGDLFYNGVAPKDIWSFDDISGWVNVTNDWGTVGGDRVLFAYCTHKDELYMAGGQTDYGPSPTMFTDIVKWNGSVWVKTGNLPIDNFSTGILASDGTNLYMYGGGQYNSGGHTHFNDKIYKSEDDGVSWALVANLPAEFNGLMYCNGVYTPNKFGLWFLNGSTATTNQSGLWYSPNFGVTWLKCYSTPDPRHASGMCVDTDTNTCFIVSGNTTNEVVSLVQLSY